MSEKLKNRDGEEHIDYQEGYSSNERAVVLGDMNPKKGVSQFTECIWKDTL